ncbi:MAG: c-type cytochrome biogenesis protein CcmI [Burkholderiales bacterium]|nr:c-type cytochrome biogenesis protein CcmI [Burkholderiales bacterium]
MTAFVVAAGLLVIVALGWLIVPLMRTGRAPGIERGASNVAILRDQLAELDADLAAGTLSRAQYDPAREELERRVLEETAQEERRTASTARAGPWTAVALAVTIPLAAGLLYLQLGSLDAFSPQASAWQGSRHRFGQEEIDGLIARLEARLRENPDPQGFLILARTYYALQRFHEAVAAFERVGESGIRDPDYLADYADALAVVEGGKLAGKPLALVERALALDPDHVKALALAGSEAFARQDYKTAVAYWERLRAVAASDSEFARAVVASIDEARRLGSLGAAAPATPAALAPAVPHPPMSRDAPEASVAVASGARVAGVVRLAPALAAKTDPNDTLFVFARAAEGPRIPLAIVKRRVKDLPFEFSLDDSQAMAPGMALSNFADVVVGARISKTANATPQAGDLEGLSQTVRVGSTDVAVVIDKVLP